MAAQKKSLRWRDDDVISFIQCYKELECLWNPKLEDYKDTRKRAKAYETLKNKMNSCGLLTLNVNDVRTKIKGLRTTYCDELRKIMKSARSSKGQYEPKLFWFSIADSFLRGVTEQRKTLCMKETAVVKIRRANLKRTRNEPEKESNSTSNTTTKNSNDLLKHQPSTSNSIVTDNLKTVTERDRQDFDEFDHFARSIAIQLRKLPELEALELMQEMQVLLINKKRKLLLDDKSREKLLLDDKSGENVHQNRKRKSSENITGDSDDAIVEYFDEEYTDPLDQSGLLEIKEEF